MYLVSCCVRKSPLQEMEGAGLAPHTLQLSLRLEPSRRDSRPELEVTSSLTGASTNSSWSEACRGRTRSVLEASQVITLLVMLRGTLGRLSWVTVWPALEELKDQKDDERLVWCLVRSLTVCSSGPVWCPLATRSGWVAVSLPH